MGFIIDYGIHTRIDAMAGSRHVGHAPLPTMRGTQLEHMVWPQAVRTLISIISSMQTTHSLAVATRAGGAASGGVAAWGGG